LDEACRKSCSNDQPARRADPAAFQGCLQPSCIDETCSFLSECASYFLILEAQAYLARFAQCLTLVTALAAAMPVDAASAIYGNYYDETPGLQHCDGAAMCNCRFSQLPPNKLIIIKKVHFRFETSTPVVRAYLSASATQGGPTLGRYVPLAIPNTVTAQNGVYFVTIDADAQWLFGQGRFPYVEVDATNTSSTFIVDCAIRGELIDPLP
jgi:hypothetical protein